MHHDAATDVTILHRTEPGDAVAPPLLEAMLRCADEELNRELGEPAVPGRPTQGRTARRSGP